MILELHVISMEIIFSVRGDFMSWEKQADEFIEKYCTKHKISYREALRHKLVQETIEYYKNAEKGKISVTEINAGCGGAEFGGDCK